MPLSPADTGHPVASALEQAHAREHMTGPLSFVVTGASGGVGSVIAEHLASLDHVIVNLDPDRPRHPRAGVHHHEGSAGDPIAALTAAELA